MYFKNQMFLRWKPKIYVFLLVFSSETVGSIEWLVCLNYFASFSIWRSSFQEYVATAIFILFYAVLWF